MSKILMNDLDNDLEEINEINLEYDYPTRIFYGDEAVVRSVEVEEVKVVN